MSEPLRTVTDVAKPLPNGEGLGWGYDADVVLPPPTLPQRGGEKIAHYASRCSLPFAALAEPGGFIGDPRFAAPAPAPAAEPDDPVARAWHDGFAAGHAEAEAAARARDEADTACRGKLELGFAKLGAECAEDLRGKLVETVAALCEVALAPLALDPDALARRAAVAAAMLARADDERVLRLHPDDLLLVEGRLPPDLAVTPDPALERGALRLEGAIGGVEDGPSHWRRAIAEALARC